MIDLDALPTGFPEIDRRARRYGIPPGLLERHLARQRCSACGDFLPDPRKAVIDHDHACCPKTPACGSCFRGVLCGPCNTALGMVRDRAEVLRALADYLERPR